MTDVISLCGSKPGQMLRRFANTQADFAHLILVKNSALATEANRKWGLPNEYSVYAFDFALACRVGANRF